MLNNYFSVFQNIYNRFKNREYSAELLLLISCLFFSIIYNIPFWRSAVNFLSPLSFKIVFDFLLIGLAITCLHFLILLSFAMRVTVKPILIGLYLVGACATYYSLHFNTYFDVSMINNILETDYLESRELLTGGIVRFLVMVTFIPCLLLILVPVKKYTLKSALKRRLFFMGVTFIVLLVCVLLSYQTFSGLMRNHKELRYLINPGNIIVSLPRALLGKAEIAQLKKAPIGLDAHKTDTKDKPVLLVLVIGETVRAANWGLNGYSRETTPRLSKQEGLINFTDVASCGTSTAVSLPCIFSGKERKKYSDQYARSHESLLNLVARAGIDVEWVDNQSGCKGVCDGVETDQISTTQLPVICNQEHCMDAILSKDIEDELSENDGDQLLVLHMMGSHGPAYFRRYPDTLKEFVPACENEDLTKCTREEIINSYDNSIYYTDLVLSTILDRLKQDQSRDIALIYVSDHGESLGEMGVYLHGLPYLIAPDEQKKVPMVWWLSDSLVARENLNINCIRQIANQPTSHDNIFHTVLGLLGVESSVYHKTMDLSYQCRYPQ